MITDCSKLRMLSINLQVNFRHNLTSSAKPNPKKLFYFDTKQILKTEKFRFHPRKRKKTFLEAKISYSLGYTHLRLSFKLKDDISTPK